MKERTLKNQDAADFFITFEPIVCGVLKRLNLNLLHPSYDDYKQIGLLKLIDAYEEFPGQLEAEEELYKFSGYAFTKVRWAVLDELRKLQRSAQIETAMPESHETLGEFGETKEKEESDHAVFYKQFKQKLTEKEKVFLKERYEKGLSITELSKKLGVSRKTLYQRRDEIAKKYREFEGANR